MKPIHTYKIEFKIYGEYASQDINVSAYSPKQAKKYFFDWWRRYHKSKYAVVILISQLDDKYAEKLAMNTTGETIPERFKRQCDYIYRRKEESNG